MMSYRETRATPLIMPLKVTREVIGDTIVIRFNGNNITGSREDWGPRRSAIHRKKITSWQKAKAERRAKEALYTRRYLGGA